MGRNAVSTGVTMPGLSFEEFTATAPPAAKPISFEDFASEPAPATPAAPTVAENATVAPAAAPATAAPPVIEQGPSGPIKVVEPVYHEPTPQPTITQTPYGMVKEVQPMQPTAQAVKPTQPDVRTDGVRGIVGGINQLAGGTVDIVKNSVDSVFGEAGATVASMEEPNMPGMSYGGGPVVPLEMAKKGRENARTEIRQYQQAHPEQAPQPGTIPSLIRMAPTVAGYAIPGNQLNMAVSFQGQGYQQAKDMGATEEAAHAVGAVQFLTAWIPASVFSRIAPGAMRNVMANAGKTVLGQGGKELTKDVVLSSASGAIQGAINDGSIQLATNPDGKPLDYKQMLEAAWESGKALGVLGGLTHLGGRAVGKVRQPSQQEQRPEVAPEVTQEPTATLEAPKPAPAPEAKPTEIVAPAQASEAVAAPTPPVVKEPLATEPQLKNQGENFTTPKDQARQALREGIARDNQPPFEPTSDVQVAPGAFSGEVQGGRATSEGGTRKPLQREAEAKPAPLPSESRPLAGKPAEPVDRIVSELESIETAKAALKKRAMGYQVDLKEQVADALGVPVESVDLPYHQWAQIREAFNSGDMAKAKELASPKPTEANAPAKGDIYQTRAGGKDWYAIRGESKSGVGDRLFPTRYEAEAELKRTAEVESQNAAYRQSEAQKKAELDKAQAVLDDIDGFADAASPMQKAKVLATLQKQIVSNRKASSRRDLVRDRVGDGATVVTSNGERRLTNPNGSYLAESQISKTAMDYAEHLIAKREPVTPQASKATEGEVAPAAPLPRGKRKAKDVIEEGRKAKADAAPRKMADVVKDAKEKKDEEADYSTMSSSDLDKVIKDLYAKNRAERQSAAAPFDAKISVLNDELRSHYKQGGKLRAGARHEAESRRIRNEISDAEQAKMTAVPVSNSFHTDIMSHPAIREQNRRFKAAKIAQDEQFAKQRQDAEANLKTRAAGMEKSLGQGDIGKAAKAIVDFYDTNVAKEDAWQKATEEQRADGRNRQIVGAFDAAERLKKALDANDVGTVVGMFGMRNPMWVEAFKSLTGEKIPNNNRPEFFAKFFGEKYTKWQSEKAKARDEKAKEADRKRIETELSRGVRWTFAGQRNQSTTTKEMIDNILDMPGVELRESKKGPFKVLQLVVGREGMPLNKKVEQDYARMQFDKKQTLERVHENVNKPVSEGGLRGESEGILSKPAAKSAANSSEVLPEAYRDDFKKLSAILDKQVGNEVTANRKSIAALGVIHGEAPELQKALAERFKTIAPDGYEYAANTPTSVPIGLRDLFKKSDQEGTFSKAGEKSAAKLKELMGNGGSTSLDITKVPEMMYHLTVVGLDVLERQIRKGVRSYVQWKKAMDAELAELGNKKEWDDKSVWEAMSEGRKKLDEMNPETTSQAEAVKTSEGTGESQTTSNKNAMMQAAREARGEKPIDEPKPETMQQWQDEAKAKIETDPELPNRLVEELQSAPRPVTKIENAVLDLHRRKLDNAVAAKHKEMLAASDAGDMQAKDAAQAAASEYQAQYNALDAASKAGGSETGRALSARREELNADYSIAALTRRAEIVKGERVNPQEQAKIAEQAQQIIDAQAKNAQQEAQIAKLISDLADAEAKAAAAKKPTLRERVEGRPTRKDYGSRNRLITKDAYESAKREFASASSMNFLGAKQLELAAKIGLYHAEAIGRDFAAWSKAMLADVGENAKPHLQQIWDDTQKQMIAADKAKREERYNKAVATRSIRQIGELSKGLLTGEYVKKVKELHTLTKENESLRFEVERYKRAADEDLFKMQLQQRSTARKIFDTGVEGVNLSRAVMTSLDVSAIARQGGFVLFSHPLRAAKAIPAMFRAMASERGQWRVESEIRSRENAPLYKKAGLYFSTDVGPLAKMEEAYMSRWAGRIPLISHSQRAYTTYLNRLRADSFDAMARALSKTGKATDAEGKAIASFINVATGRGNIQGHENKMTALSTVFFAPRLVISRFQLLAGQPLYRGSWRSRKLIAMEYARYLIGIGTVYALAKYMGADVEDDPRSTEFGKIKTGNTRIDPLSGLSQATVVLAKVLSGEQKDSHGKIIRTRDMGDNEYAVRQALHLGGTKGDTVPFKSDNAADLIFRFGRTKLSPASGTVVNTLAGEDVVGNPVTPTSTAKNLLVPMIANDTVDAIQDQGVPKGMALALMAMLGMSINTYEKKAKKVKATGLAAKPTF